VKGYLKYSNAIIGYYSFLMLVKHYFKVSIGNVSGTFFELKCIRPFPNILGWLMLRTLFKKIEFRHSKSMQFDNFFINFVNLCRLV